MWNTQAHTITSTCMYSTHSQSWLYIRKPSHYMYYMLNCLALKCCVFTWEKLLSFGIISRVKICVEIAMRVRCSLSPLTWSVSHTSLIPRPHGKRESGLISTACACVPISRKPGNSCKWLVKSIHIIMSESLPYYQKAASYKMFSQAHRVSETLFEPAS